MRRRLLGGSPAPLGANWDGDGTNFALFSAHAEKVELCLFDASGRRETDRLDLPQCSDQVWYGYLPDCGPGTVYGYRVHGPYRPERGHRFNPRKLLVDPYGKQLCGAVDWCPAVYGFQGQDAVSDSGMNTDDSAGFVPKSVVVDESFDWGDDRPPKHPWSQTVIYEAHVRGFTRLHPQIAPGERGRFAALGSGPVIDYLKALGITAVELLPVHEFIDDFFLVDRQKRNYWGYNSLGFFAPASRYLCNGDRNEFKRMVRNLHRAGIEVILDVVYNHTAEGNQDGPTLCFRGIDNASYYRLPKEDPSLYINDSGCGNSLNTAHPRVRQMVIDSLRYWVSEMHVDGFRFDLAVSLGREDHGFDAGGSFFRAIRNDPLLSQVKLIAEPWDVGPGGYRLGAFPTGWAEWNDRFRDCLRRFWRGDPGQLPDLARNFHGSSDLFEHNGRRPWSSINFAASHDGFTLKDLVSYRGKHNEANGESNNDGHDANFSENYGVEGETDDEAIGELRLRQMKNLLATVFLSQGTPMLLAGDELGHSQSGNNNAYCQDNELSWLDWPALTSNTPLLDFTRRLIQLRRESPLLRRNRFVHGEKLPGHDDFSNLQWLAPTGETMRESDWQDPRYNFLAVQLASASKPEDDQRRNEEEATALLIVFNAEAVAVEFAPPKYRYPWQRVFSTAGDSLEKIGGDKVAIEAGSVQLFELMTQP